jgi:hypothetical protein
MITRSDVFKVVSSQVRDMANRLVWGKIPVETVYSLFKQKRDHMLRSIDELVWLGSGALVFSQICFSSIKQHPGFPLLNVGICRRHEND